MVTTMKTYNTFNLWAKASLIAISLIVEKLWFQEGLMNEQALPDSYRDYDIGQLPYYNGLQVEYDFEDEHVDWTGKDLESLLYEMSTEANPGK